MLQANLLMLISHPEILVLQHFYAMIFIFLFHFSEELW